MVIEEIPTPITLLFASFIIGSGYLALLSLIKEGVFSMKNFDKKEDFVTFSRSLGVLIGKTQSEISRQVDHEIEHSIPYKKENISSYYGWHKFKGGHFLAYHLPYGKKYDFLSEVEKDKLKYKSLKATSWRSDGDKEDIKGLEERYGDKIKEVAQKNE